MSEFLFLVPLSLALGLVGLLAFLWSLNSEQYDDLEGAAQRILHDEDRPIELPDQLSDKPDSDGN